MNINRQPTAKEVNAQIGHLMVTEVIWAMSPDSKDFDKLSEKYQKMGREAYEKGYSNFWYHPDYGLFADAPNANMEDDRVLLDKIGFA